MGFLSYEHLTNQISKIDFTFISLLACVVLVFTATHFIYRTFSYKRQTKIANHRLETLERTISELTGEKETLEKKVRLMERDLRISNARALDHTLHIKSTSLRTPEDD